MSGNAYCKSPILFAAAETRLEGLGEKWRRFCVLLTTSLETLGSHILEVTLGYCQIHVTAEDSMDGCKEVSH